MTTAAWIVEAVLVVLLAALFWAYGRYTKALARSFRLDPDRYLSRREAKRRAQ